MPQISLENSGLFKVDDDPLFLETDFERSVGGGDEPPAHTNVQIFSRKRKELAAQRAEIFGHPVWQTKAVQNALAPLIGTADLTYDHFYNTLMANDLELEAMLIATIVGGFFNSNQKGDLSYDFEVYDGKPSAFAVALDKSGLVQLPKKMMSHSEVFKDGFNQASDRVISKQATPEQREQFSKIMDEKGKDLGAIMRARFPNPKFGPNERRDMTLHVGEVVGKEIKKSLGRDGIDDQGNIVVGGKIYNITDDNDVTSMINNIVEGKYPLKPSNRAHSDLDMKERSLPNARGPETPQFNGRS